MHNPSLRVWVLIMLSGDYLIHLFVEDAILKSRLQNINVTFLLTELTFNHFTPNGYYVCRTAQLTSRCCILYLYSTNIRTEYFKICSIISIFSLQIAIYFIMLPFLVLALFTF